MWYNRSYARYHSFSYDDNHKSRSGRDESACSRFRRRLRTTTVRQNAACHFVRQKSGALHKLATKEIKAEAQADKIEKLLPCLSEEEVAVYKRARNAHYSSSAKNASIGDYKKASGFEALLGYLYLTGKHDRLNELLSIE